MMRGRLTTIAAAAAAAALLMGVGASTVEPTSAVWVDSGGATLTVTGDKDPLPLTLPITSEDPNTIISTNPGDWTWTSQGGGPPTPNHFCVAFEITTLSTELVPWRVGLHFDVPPFNWVAPFTDEMFYSIYFPGDPYFATLTRADDYAISGLVYVDSFEFNADQLVSAAEPWTEVICANVADPPWQPEGPGTYTVVSATLDTPIGYSPCVTVVVTGHLPYFVGFTANFDYKAILDQALSDFVIDSVTYARWLPLVTWAGSTASGFTGANYLVTLTGYQPSTRNINSFADVTLQACAY